MFNGPSGLLNTLLRVFVKIRSANLKRAEEFRLLLIILAFGAPMALLFFVSIESITKFERGMVVAALVALGFFLAALVQLRVKIACPNCGGALNENLANSPKGSTDNVEHTCSDCEAVFIEGRRRDA